MAYHPFEAMIKKLLALALAVPAAYAAVVVFHPGVALDVTPLAKGQPQTLQAPGEYTVDPMHTSVGFDIGHLGLSRVQGRFTDVSGKLHVDPKHLDQDSVTFRIGTDSVDTAVAPRNAHLKTKDFFDVATYPEITFASRRIAKKGHGYIAYGDLTMHGVTKPVEIPFKAYGPAPVGAEMGGVRVGIVSDPFTLDRMDFGIPYDQKLPDGSPAVSHDVDIRLSMEATLDK